MSGKLVGLIWEKDLDRNLREVLQCMADHAYDDGTRVFPSIEKTSWKTGYSIRQVQRAVKTLVGMKVLIVVMRATQHRPTEYRIDISVLADKQPFEEWKLEHGRDSSRANLSLLKEKVSGDIQAPSSDISTISSDIQMSPESSLEPSNKNLSGAHAPETHRVSQKPVATPKGPSWNEVKTELTKQFSRITGLPVPRHDTIPLAKKANMLWWTPLRTLYDMTGQSIPDTVALLQDAVIQMRSSPKRLTLASPASVEKTALSLFSERSGYSFDPAQLAGLRLQEMGYEKLSGT